MLEEYLTNTDGLVVSDSTWTYKIPTIDTIPKNFNVQVLNSGHHEKRVLSSKGTVISSFHHLKGDFKIFHVSCAGKRYTLLKPSMLLEYGFGHPIQVRSRSWIPHYVDLRICFGFWGGGTNRSMGMNVKIPSINIYYYIRSVDFDN